MCDTFSEGDINYWHGILYPGPDITQKLASAKVIQGAVRGCRGRRATKQLQEITDQKVAKLQASILRAPPDKDKVARLIKKLDHGKPHAHSLEETKILFSNLLRVDVGHIPDDHTELQSCVGLTSEAIQHANTDVDPNPNSCHGGAG